MGYTDIRFKLNSHDPQDSLHLFEIFVNYWEIKPAQYETKLQEIALQGVRKVSAFIPWAHFETDLYHSLKKFLKAAFNARMEVRLWILPELGVNYPFVGIPRDLIQNHASIAVDRAGKVLYNIAAPHVFPLPSFASSIVSKRLESYLLKLGAVFQEAFTEVDNDRFCEAMLSNSLLNCYKNVGPVAHEDWGDHSAATVLPYRDFLDEEYVTPQADSEDIEHFKLPFYDLQNRHLFFSRFEKELKEKAAFLLKKKCPKLTCAYSNALNPECDPHVSSEALLSEVYAVKPPLFHYYQSIVRSSIRGEKVFFNDFGAFRNFSDVEKDFLYSSSLIYTGGLRLSFEEFSKLTNCDSMVSQTVNALQSMKEKNYSLLKNAVYLAPSQSPLTQEAFQKFNHINLGHFSLCSMNEFLDEPGDGRLIFVDPKMILKPSEFSVLLTQAQKGKTVVLPQPLSEGFSLRNYARPASLQYEQFKKMREPLTMNWGLGQKVYAYDDGFAVFYDAEIFWKENSSSEALQPLNGGLSLFFNGVLGLSEQELACTAQMGVDLVFYSSPNSDKKTVFVLNPSPKTRKARLVCRKPVVWTHIESKPVHFLEMDVPGYAIVPLEFIENSAIQSALSQGEGSSAWI